MSLATFILATTMAAAPDAVGIATSAGGFRIGNLPVTGTGSVVEGALVETEGRPARVQLRNGQTVELGSQSSARVYADRLFLESGTSTVRGRMNVLNAQGVLVAQTTETPVSFQAASVPSSSAELSGVVELKDGALVIHDEASRLTFTLDAAGETAEQLTQAAGTKVSVKGILKAGRVQVSSVELLTATAVAGGAAGAGAAATAGTAGAAAGAAGAAGAGAGAATAATTAAVLGVSKAVIAGVAIAGVAATGATVGFVQSQSQPASTVSQ